MPRVIIRPRAERDLIEAFDFIAERGGEERATMVLRRIARKMESQAHYPLAAQRRDELRPNLRSVPVSGYVIFYFPLPDGIQVSRVLYGRRDIEGLFGAEADDEDEGP